MAKRMRGKDRLRRILLGMPAKQRARVREALKQGAQEIVTAQKLLAPVRTGALQDSIKYTPGDQNVPAYAQFRSKTPAKDPELAMIITAGNRKVREAHLVEFGTAPHSVAKGARRKKGYLQDKGPHHPGAAPHHFFLPGFTSHIRSVQRNIRKAAKQAIKDAIAAAGAREAA